MQDVYVDNGALLKQKFPRLEDVPETLQAAVDLRDVREKLADTDFALCMDDVRLYPIVDAGNTALSTIYFLETGQDIPAPMRKEAACCLVAACAAFDIAAPEPLVKIASGEIPEPIAAPSKDSLPRRLAYFEEGGVFDLAPPKRREVAVALCKEATAQGVPVPDRVSRYGGNTLTPDFSLHVQARLDVLQEDSPYREVYTMLKEAAGALPPAEVAEVLYRSDVMAGLTRLYDGKLSDAFAAALCTPTSIPASIRVGEEMYTAADIQKRAAALGDLLTPEILDAFGRDAVAAFTSLPQGVQRLILR